MSEKMISELEVGKPLSCLYPSSKDGTLEPRSGMIESIGSDYVKVKTATGYRSFSFAKIVNAQFSL